MNNCIDGNATASIPKREMPTPSVLQNIVLASPDHFLISPLFTRWPSGGGRLANTNGLSLVPGEVAAFNTYYNAFSLLKWRRIAGLSTLALRLEGQGRAILRVTQYCSGGIAYPLVEREIDLAAKEVLPLVPVEQQDPEALAFTLEAVEGSDAVPVRLVAGQWLTDDAPRNQVRLATVMTTFRRETEASRTYLRYRDEILPQLPEAHLYLIDNGQTLDLPATAQITVVPNANLGGAGGFTRGLLEAQQSGKFTHVLFMDDDANCLPEAIFRTIALLRHATGDRVAVAGAMLLEESPWVQYESSAEFLRSCKEPTLWRSHGAWRDLTNWRECIRNDLDTDGNYGGWWFFAFAIKDVKALPFPFFVRGDDTDFSLSNDLSITTLNGIATTCPNLGDKSGHTTEYLSARSWLALGLLHSDANRCEILLERLLRQARHCNANWDYGRAHAILAAIEDALEGPDYFSRNPSAVARTKEIATFHPLPVLTAEERSRLVRGRKKKGLERLFDHPSPLTDSGYLPIILAPSGVAPRRVHTQGSPYKAEEQGGVLYRLIHKPALEQTLASRIKALHKARKSLVAQAAARYRADNETVRSAESWHARLDLDGMSPAILGN